jgi:hypothetical protein
MAVEAPTQAVETADLNETARNEDGRIGLAQQEEGVIVRQILEWWKDSLDRSSKRRETSKLCHQMVDGDQWEQRDRDIAKSQKRPALTFDMLSSILSAVEGQERNNRQEMKYYGVGGEDDANAANWNKLLKWVMEANGGEFELSTLFREGLISGEGWIAPYVDYLDDPEGTIGLEFVEEEEVFDDPLSKHPVGTDARFRLRVKMLTIDEGEALWPGKFEASIKACAIENQAMQETDGKGYPDIYLTPEKGGPKRYDRKDATWAVIQAFWWQIEMGWHVVNEATGLIDELTDEEFEAKKAERKQAQLAALNELISGRAVPAQQGPLGEVEAMADQQAAAMGMPVMPKVQMPPPLKAVQRPCKRVYEAFIVYDAVLECAPLKERLKVFPLTPLRGTRRKSKNDFTGIIERIIDAQKQHNVEQSVIVQLMQLMPKASFMGPKGSFHNKTEWENGVAVPGKMLEYNAQRGKPEPIPQPTLPRHLIDMAFTRPQAMRDISGVNVELTGQRQGSDAGVVMEQRAKAAQTVLAPLFDNARRTKKLLGKILLAFMQAHITPQRQIRILGPEKAGEVVQVTPDMLQGRYDFAVDETNSTINDRVATLNIMQTTLPQMMKAGVPIPPSFVDLLPMDPKIRDEWKTMISWQLTLSNALPPPGWKPGMPNPYALPPGAAPPAEGAPAPQPAQ